MNLSKRCKCLLWISTLHLFFALSAVAETIILPKTLTIIESQVFSGCNAITKVIIPETVEFIALDAFENLQKQVVIETPKNSYAWNWAIENNFRVVESTNVATDSNASLDFGGKTIFIYNYLSSGSEQKPNSSEGEQALYNYEEWLMEKYHCTIRHVREGNGVANVQRLIDFCNNPDDTLRLYILPSNSISAPFSNHLLAPWDQNRVNFSNIKWNKSVIHFMTKEDSVYGTAVGKSEPCQCIYFNKRILSEAGIDWNTIYDMQANGSWTWANFESLLAQVHKDTDNDGTIDIYGLSGHSSDWYMMGVISNGDEFFRYNNGKLEIASNSVHALEGLNWTKRIWNEYARKQDASDPWDYFKDVWAEGICAFYIHQAYAGFDKQCEMRDLKDEWGCVAFPKGPNGTTYLNITTNDITIIPNVYDSETTSNLAFIYDMWTNSTLSYDHANDWSNNLYNYSDDRAIRETYAMLREPEHCIMNKAVYLGNINDILGAPLLWQLNSYTPSELIKNASPEWQTLCNQFN